MWILTFRILLRRSNTSPRQRPTCLAMALKPRMKEQAESLKLLRASKLPPLKKFFWRRLPVTLERERQKLPSRNEVCTLYNLCRQRSAIAEFKNNWQNTIVSLLVQREVALVAKEMAQRAYPVAGRVAYFLSSWWSVVSQDFCSDLDTAQGCRIEFF